MKVNTLGIIVLPGFCSAGALLIIYGLASFVYWDFGWISGVSKEGIRAVFLILSLVFMVSFWASSE